MKIDTIPIKTVNMLRSWFHPKDRNIYLSESQYIISKRVAWETTLSRFANLPGRVGFWPIWDVQHTSGNAYDNSPQGRALSYNGNPLYSIYNGIVPYIDLDGTGDFLSRADEAGMDITGGETVFHASQRGLTLGGWFWFDVNPGAIARIMAKGTTVGNLRAYHLRLSPTFQPVFGISSNGTAEAAVTATAGLNIRTWYFMVGRFIPSQRLSVWVNGEKTDETGGVPSSIFNSSVGLAVGGQADGTQLYDGRASLCFLCASALPDDTIDMLYDQSRILFGV